MRITDHTQDIVDDLKAWVELRIGLAQLEVYQKVEESINKIILAVIVAFLGFFVFMFGATAAALGLGAWLGHPAWGFLIVTAVLAIVAGILLAAKPEFMDYRQLFGVPKGLERLPSQKSTQNAGRTTKDRA